MWFDASIGKLFIADGDIYEGEYKNGFSDGSGKRKVNGLMIYFNCVHWSRRAFLE